MKFGGLEPRRYEDIKEIVAPEIDPKSFGTFEKQAPGLSLYPEGSQSRMENVYIIGDSIVYLPVQVIVLVLFI